MNIEDIMRYEKIDGRIIKKTELSVQELNTAITEANNKILQYQREKKDTITQCDERISYWQTIVTKIEGLLK